MYETTLKALKALDARFDPPAATLTFSMGVCVAANDGQTCFGEVSCDDPNCTQQIFGNTATTRAEFSVAKHVLVHEKRKLNPPKPKAPKPVAPASNVPKGTAKDPSFGKSVARGGKLAQATLVSPAAAGDNAPSTSAAEDAPRTLGGYFEYANAEDKYEVASVEAAKSLERDRYLRSLPSRPRRAHRSHQARVRAKTCRSQLGSKPSGWRRRRRSALPSLAAFRSHRRRRRWRPRCR